MNKILFILLLPIMLLGQSKVVAYNWTNWQSTLTSMTEEERFALIRTLHWGDSVKVNKVWHTKFVLPKRKVWKWENTFERLYLPVDNNENTWWTTNGKDVCVIEGKKVIDPDTLQVVELQILDGIITHKTYIKNGKNGVLDIKGIASKDIAEIHYKKTKVYKSKDKQVLVEVSIKEPDEELSEIINRNR